MIDGKIAAITDFGLNPVVSDIKQGTDPGNSYFGDIDGCERVSYFASWIDSVVNSPIGGPEFRVNTTVANDQKWSSVAMDDNGDFAITWTSYGQDGGGNGPGAGVNGQNGVYVQRYDSTGTAVGGEFRANTFTDGNQQYSKIAMDAAGDFTVVWESYQDRPTFNGTTVNPADAPNSYGIYGQQYVRNSLVGRGPLYRPQRRIPERVRRQHDQGRRPAIPEPSPWTTTATSWSSGAASAA